MTEMLFLSGTYLFSLCLAVSLISFIYIHLCDFAKRCPLSFHLNSRCTWKKTRGLAVLLGVSREPRPRPICGWVADLFCVKTRRVGRGESVTLIRVSCQKAVQSQRIFPVG